MKIYLKKQHHSLYPADEESLEAVKKLSKDKTYHVDIKMARNYDFHKKYFSLLEYGYDNQNENNKIKYDNFDSFRKEIVMKCGFYTVHITTKGHKLHFPDSISFAKMDEDKFQKLYDRTIDVIIKHFVPGDSAEHIDQVLSYL